MSTTTEPVSLTAAEKGYVKPDVLVTTDWVAQHLNDPKVRILESDEDVLLYDLGPHPGRAEDRLARRPERFGRARLRLEGAVPGAAAPARDRRVDDGRLLRRQEQLVGDVRVLGVPAVRLHEREGPRRRAREVGAGRPADRRPTCRSIRRRSTCAKERDDAKIRAFKDETLAHSKAKKPLVDVRSPDEFSGKKTHMPEYPQEGVLRGGHIPGAKSVPWARAANPDGTFKTADELRAIYEGESGPEAERRRRRLLPHRRALEPHLVRAHVPARLRQGAQLRRQLDGVGQLGPSPGREVSR